MDDDELIVFKTVDYNSNDIYRAGYNVAVVCAVTTKGFVKEYNTNHNFEEMMLFVDLLPSFCKTASRGIKYTLYIAYDFDDPLLQHIKNLRSFKIMFNDLTSKHCKALDLKVEYVKCFTSNRPAASQNTAMIHAYKDNNDYLFRVNDDTVLTTTNWTEMFISVLLNMNPPNLGVIGPIVDMEKVGLLYPGNTKVLTYEFVHKTHFDIFGYHYPDVFRNWYADDWMSRVYQPFWAVRLNQVRVKHTESCGVRYEPTNDVLSIIDEEIMIGRRKINEYV